jgi:hypothetical protein
MMSDDPIETSDRFAPPRTELVARIEELEREIALRDQQLKVRGAVIRRLRRDLANARASHERLVASRSYRLLKGVHRTTSAVSPRALAAAIRERLMRGRAV